MSQAQSKQELKRRVWAVKTGMFQLKNLEERIEKGDIIDNSGIKELVIKVEYDKSGPSCEILSRYCEHGEHGRYIEHKFYTIGAAGELISSSVSNMIRESEKAHYTYNRRLKRAGL